MLVVQRYPEIRKDRHEFICGRTHSLEQFIHNTIDTYREENQKQTAERTLPENCETIELSIGITIDQHEFLTRNNINLTNLLNEIIYQRIQTEQKRPNVDSKTLSELSIESNNRLNKTRRDDNDWPTTDELRDELQSRIRRMINTESFVLIPSPTSSGKSYNGASTAWKASGLTDNSPVVHLHATTDSRDEAMEMSQKAGVEATKLLGRNNACPIVNGEYDSEINVPGNGDINASDWILNQVSNKGNTFSQAHSYLEEYNGGSLPCDPCKSITQWEDTPRDDDENVTYDVIHATHNFAYVPTLVDEANLLIDEQPNFKSSIGEDDSDEMSRSRFQDIIIAWLKKIDAYVTSWESFVSIASHGGDGKLKQSLEDSPNVSEEWFIINPDAHALAPALTDAAYNAFTSESDANGRRVGDTTSSLKRFDEDHGSNDVDFRFNRTRIQLLIDEDNNPLGYWNIPELGNARSIVCLDAWPSIHEWKQNIGEGLSVERLISDEMFENWRRHERGLEVVQIGEADRPAATEHAVQNYTKPNQQKVVIESLRNKYGKEFNSVIYPQQMDDQIRAFLPDNVRTMTYGNVRSNNEFKSDRIGLVSNSMDPGDAYVIDLLAARDLDATPKMADCKWCDGDDPMCNQCDGDGKNGREPGREFIGPDASDAADILAGIRTNSVAQAVGRWSRGPKTPRAIVFVRTAVVPNEMIDTQIDKAWMFSEKQKAVIDYINTNAAATVAEIVEATDVSDSSVRRTIERLISHDLLNRGEIDGVNQHVIIKDIPEKGHLDVCTL